MLATAAATAGIAVLVNRYLFSRKPTKSQNYHDDNENPFQDPITSIEELRQVIPAGLSGSKVENAHKVVSQLDHQMMEFIQQSPMVFLATANAQGLPFVSPKGDAPGFVQVTSDGRQLLLPDRPGNRLIFGWQNILENPNVGMLFQIPGNDTTLRISGTARLYRDRTLCHRFAARGLDATVVLVVQVQYAFFHCSKAYIRSQLWKPETWPKEPMKVKFGPYFSSVSMIQQQIDKGVDNHFHLVQQSVDGVCAEPS